jgi:hypothetical protein
MQDSRPSSIVSTTVEKGRRDSLDSLVAFPWRWRTERALLETQVLLRVILNTEVICQILRVRRGQRFR